MRLLRPIAALAALLLMACGSAEPALAQRDTVKVHVEVPTAMVVRVDTVHSPVDSAALLAAHAALTTLQAQHAQDSVLVASLNAHMATLFDTALAYKQSRDSLLHLPPPVPPPPVHDTTHDTVTVVKVVTVDVAYDPTAVDSMKIWRVDTSPPTDLAAMPIGVGQTVPIRVDCFNHAKQQIDCPANLSISSSDPSIASVTIAPRSTSSNTVPVAPAAPSPSLPRP